MPSTATPPCPAVAPTDSAPPSLGLTPRLMARPREARPLNFVRAAASSSTSQKLTDTMREPESIQPRMAQLNTGCLLRDKHRAWGEVERCCHVQIAGQWAASPHGTRTPAHARTSTHTHQHTNASIHTQSSTLTSTLTSTRTPAHAPTRTPTLACTPTPAPAQAHQHTHVHISNMPAYAHQHTHTSTRTPPPWIPIHLPWHTPGVHLGDGVADDVRSEAVADAVREVHDAEHGATGLGRVDVHQRRLQVGASHAAEQPCRARTQRRRGTG